MRLILGRRGTGKTIQAIMTSNATGAVILVADERKKEFVITEAKRLKRKIPEPITVFDLRRWRSSVKPVLIIDDLDAMLEKILERDLECSILASFMSVDEIIERISEEPEEESEDKE